MGGPSLPWAMIEPHERQAQVNHAQNLATLAGRGGLDCIEAMAVLEDRRLPHFVGVADAAARKADDHAKLVAALAEYERSTERVSLTADLAKAERERDQHREAIVRACSALRVPVEGGDWRAVESALVDACLAERGVDALFAAAATRPEGFAVGNLDPVEDRDPPERGVT